MFKRTRLLIFISAILFTPCYYKNEKGPDNEIFQSDGIVSDTTKVLSDVVLKGSFIKETWCNGSLQAWQKAIVPIETQVIQPENRAHIYSTYTVNILFIMFALVGLALILIMDSYLTINTKLALNLLMTV